MNRAQIESEYTVQNGIIRNPGKFEGEPVYAPYFYDAMLNGFQDETVDRDGDSAVDFFGISEEDTAMFPELGKAYRLALWQDDSGFVHTETHS